MTKASEHDHQILPDLKSQLANCMLLDDIGYIGKEIQFALFNQARIRLKIQLKTLSVAIRKT